MGGVATLYAEELKATMRGRFAWLGAAVILLAIGGLATVGTQDTWLDGYGIIAYGLVPLGFIPLAAGAIASPRANRFVESVFTAPVERRDWLIAKVLVLLTLAAAYYVALIPMLLVYTHHVGLPFLLGRFLLWTPGILIASIAIGTLIGVLFIGRSVAAPAAAGMGVLLAYVGLVPLQELMVARGNGATRSGHIALASPAVLLKNALGFTLAVGSIPATTTADVDQPAGRRDRSVRPGGLGVSARPGRRNVGGDARPAVDDRARDRRDRPAAGHAGGHQLRYPGAPAESRAGPPGHLRASERQPGSGSVRRPDSPRAAAARS